MKVKAAIAIEKGKPLIIDYVDLERPKKGEVLVEIKSTGVCHTDAYTPVSYTHLTLPTILLV